MTSRDPRLPSPRGSGSSGVSSQPIFARGGAYHESSPFPPNGASSSLSTANVPPSTRRYERVPDMSELEANTSLSGLAPTTLGGSLPLTPATQHHYTNTIPSTSKGAAAAGAGGSGAAFPYPTPGVDAAGQGHGTMRVPSPGSLSVAAAPSGGSSMFAPRRRRWVWGIALLFIVAVLLIIAIVSIAVSFEQAEVRA